MEQNKKIRLCELERELILSSEYIKINEYVELKLEESSEHFINSNFRINIWTLSKNIVNVLLSFAKLQDKKDFVEIDKIYNFSKKGSNTAFITQLKYFGAIEPYFTEKDLLKKSKRSGKWKLSFAGKEFLKGVGKLPSHISIQNKKIISKGEEILIQDEKIKWKTEDNIWEELNTLHI